MAGENQLARLSALGRDYTTGLTPDELARIDQLGLPDFYPVQGRFAWSAIPGATRDALRSLAAGGGVPEMIQGLPAYLGGLANKASQMGAYAVGANPLTTDQLIPMATDVTMGIMGGGMPGAEAGAVGAAGGRLTQPARLAPDVAGGVGRGVRLAEEYVPNAPPTPTLDKNKGTYYPKKTLSEQGLEVQSQRQAAQAAIDAGNYTPYFDPAKRYDVNPANYPPYEPTIDLLAKKPETQAKYEAMANAPEAMTNLDQAFQRGMQQADKAGNWYYMGQLEDAFVKELGPEAGRQAFKEKFADAMAATTGGADPTQNLMMAHYGNYMKNKGLPVPTEAYDIPFPLGGGKYGIKNNMKQYNDMIFNDAGIGLDNPKRYNFSNNFLGNKGGTLDEQMMTAFPGGYAMPPPGTYGHFENALTQAAARAGVDPRYFQEVAWAGIKDIKNEAKGGYQAVPMIDIVNQAIERTSRITGLPPEEVVRRGLIRSEMPLYTGGNPLLGGMVQQNNP